MYTRCKRCKCFTSSRNSPKVTNRGRDCLKLTIGSVENLFLFRSKINSAKLFHSPIRLSSDARARVSTHLIKRARYRRPTLDVIAISAERAETYFVQPYIQLNRSQFYRLESSAGGVKARITKIIKASARVSLRNKVKVR